MRLLLLVNTSASSVTARGRVVIQKALAADHTVTIAETSRRGHAARLAQGAAADGYDAVVVLGGDGTLSEAANGLVGTTTALAVLPGGSTNVFARTIGLTNDPIEATGELLATLARPDWSRPIGLGSVNGRSFLFHVGIGFDAAVVAQVERRSGLKRWAGHPLFVYSAFATWLRHYDRTHPAITVQLGSDTEVSGAYLTVCLNSDPYTFLGNRPLHLAPETTLASPLTMVAVRTMHFAPFMAMAGSALGFGRPLRARRRAVVRTGVEHYVVHCDRPMPYQVDGDYLGEGEVFAFAYEPDALRLVTP